LCPRLGKPDPVPDRLGKHVLYRRVQDELVALEHQRRRLETPALRERADRRHTALRAEVKEVEREMRAIVEGLLGVRPARLRYSPPSCAEMFGIYMTTATGSTRRVVPYPRPSSVAHDRNCDRQNPISAVNPTGRLLGAALICEETSSLECSWAP
jgi:hypothetical protein